MNKTNTLLVALIVIVLLIGCSKAITNIKEDEPFNSGLGFDESTDAICSQSDNKILISGNFNNYNGVPASKMVRLNLDGSIDKSFTARTFNGDVRNMQVQSDGKIMVCGNFTTYNNVTAGKLIRLNPDGSLDNSFYAYDGDIFPKTFLTFSDEVIYILVQKDNKILAVASSVSEGSRLVRFNTDGTLDKTFGSNGVILTNGDIGSLYQNNSGTIYLGGNFTEANGIPCNGLLKLSKDAIIDMQFAFNIPISFISTICDDGNGGAIIGGDFGLIKVSTNGTTSTLVSNVNIKKALYYAGNILYFNTSGQIVKIDAANGNVDSEFHNVVQSSNNVNSGIILNNKLFITGSFTYLNNKISNRIACLNLQ